MLNIVRAQLSAMKKKRKIYYNVNERRRNMTNIINTPYQKSWVHLGRVRLGSIRNKNNWNNASKRLFGSYSQSGIPGFPFLPFCSQEQEQNSWNKFRNIFLFRNIPNERALSVFNFQYRKIKKYKYT